MELLEKQQVQAHPSAIVQGKNYRFTVLTSQLIRIEYDRDGLFEDRRTQSVWNREFDVPNFRVVEDDEQLQIITEHVHLYYAKGPFTNNSLYAEIKGNFSAYHSRWSYGMKVDTLKGTARTLDGIDGEIELEEGILSKNGVACLDDSSSFVLTEENWIEPRKKGVVDQYLFAYGRQYLKALHDFYQLTGPTPLLPRQVMGNWWSRYWRYDEQEYKELMTRFQAKDVPFSVAVIDMDWHLVDIPKKHGSGWTGYTWNKDLFPNPKAFMEWLHERNLWVTLNLHPADGVRAHEEMYEPMAKALGIDYQSEDPIPFDFSNPKFVDAYFKYLHHPQEKDGVDFWWIDWQQGTTSKLDGLDPLWMLNHYHGQDLARDGKRPLIFSRYAGVGSHRYPIGFSGDTVISWDSYRYQPYFTATASNIGYSWWSHDIGGHFMGAKDDELSTRWLQFGVFSPIMRLHSSCSIFNGKEPWRYGMEHEEVMKNYLRLRHQLVPYLYTMNERTHTKGIPLVQPMYYSYPYEERAYEVKNQYFFGSELMVAPITEKRHEQLKVASTTAWLPEGVWFDFFNGKKYEGNKMMRLFRGLEHQPVFAKAGAIVPMAKHIKGENDISNPTHLDIHIFPGASNEFSLYEDNGVDRSYEKGHYAETKMTFTWGEKGTFFMEKVIGDGCVVPAKRHIQLSFRGVRQLSNLQVYIDGILHDVAVEKEKDSQTVKVILPALTPHQEVKVVFDSMNALTENENKMEQLYTFLNRAEIDYGLKDHLYRLVEGTGDLYTLILELQALNIEKDVIDVILEICR